MCEESETELKTRGGSRFVEKKMMMATLARVRAWDGRTSLWSLLRGD